MPPEAQLRWSALTSQSLYYLGRDELKHKILAVAEEEGVSEASYALKLLQSEGRLTLAVATKESQTGRGRTEHYEVEGPVALLLTTTRDDPDSELANRCLTLSVNEDPQQTAAIHARQRAAYTHHGAPSDAHAVRTRHQHAQRLLEPLGVVIPWAQELTFRTDQTHYRRDHAKYLSLIAAVTLLHQYQRPETERVRDGQSRTVCCGHARRPGGGPPPGQRRTRPARRCAACRRRRQLLEFLTQYVDQRAERTTTCPGATSASRSAKCGKRAAGATGRCAANWCGWWSSNTSWPPARRAACSATISCSTTRRRATLGRGGWASWTWRSFPPRAAHAAVHRPPDAHPLGRTTAGCGGAPAAHRRATGGVPKRHEVVPL